MTLAYMPPRGHSCGPNKYGYWLGHEWDGPGTVRRCECGRTWVAVESRDPGELTNRWRPEGRFARWRRERQLRRPDQHEEGGKP